MAKNGFKYGRFIMLFAGLAEAGSLTANFTNQPSAGKQPLSKSVKKQQKPFKLSAPLTMPVSREKGFSDKKRVTAGSADSARLVAPS